MSLPEVLLWRELRRRPGGYRFRRQFPAERFASDFACLSSRVVVEVDGEAHNRGEQPGFDLKRDRIIEANGFLTLRVTARDVLKHLEECVTMIVAACRDRGPPPPSLRDGPPPRSGEDL